MHVNNYDLMDLCLLRHQKRPRIYFDLFTVRNLRYIQDLDWTKYHDEVVNLLKGYELNELGDQWFRCMSLLYEPKAVYDLIKDVSDHIQVRLDARHVIRDFMRAYCDPNIPTQEYASILFSLLTVVWYMSFESSIGTLCYYLIDGLNSKIQNEIKYNDNQSLKNSYDTLIVNGLPEFYKNHQ